MTKLKGIFFIALILVVASCAKEYKIKPKVGTPYEMVIPGDLKQSGFKVPADNPLTKEGVALGRRLFYDPILSDDGSQSCASCHQQKNAFVDANKKFSIGIDGSVGKRNSMPIFNLAFQNNFFWDGRITTLEEQALLPIEDPLEMKSSVPVAISKLQKHPEYPKLFKDAFGSDVITPTNLAKAISQFERIIVSGDSKYDRVQKGLDVFTDLEQEGKLIYEDPSHSTGGDCFHCHSMGSTFTDFDFRNNGMDLTFPDFGRFAVTGLEKDKGKFRTPTLRNIAVTGPYMHDGRFTTLDQVLQHYNLHVEQASPNLDLNLINVTPGRLPKAKREALIAFLNTLTDSTLLTNPAYAKP